jgi:hypothetical protein
MGGNAPYRNEQLARRGDDRHLAGFSGARPEALVVLTQLRIAPHRVKNRHPERLEQASVAERNGRTSRRAFLA